MSHVVCEQAYSMAQNLDPNSDGRGVLQFKTGLMSVIKVFFIILIDIYWFNMSMVLTANRKKVRLSHHVISVYWV